MQECHSAASVGDRLRKKARIAEYQKAAVTSCLSRRITANLRRQSCIRRRTDNSRQRQESALGTENEGTRRSHSRRESTTRQRGFAVLKIKRAIAGSGVACCSLLLVLVRQVKGSAWLADARTGTLSRRTEDDAILLRGGGGGSIQQGLEATWGGPPLAAPDEGGASGCCHSSSGCRPFTAAAAAAQNSCLHVDEQRQQTVGHLKQHLLRLLHRGVFSGNAPAIASNCPPREPVEGEDGSAKRCSLLQLRLQGFMLPDEQPLAVIRDGDVVTACLHNLNVTTHGTPRQADLLQQEELTPSKHKLVGRANSRHSPQSSSSSSTAYVLDLSRCRCSVYSASSNKSKS
ncbi:hypothetical protein cyc_08437 [Cyclospora cayetanensis]|uniref:Uncharacterized protein n=1 Tax=Cyclospora cayetanensis TaxID=88456 RepID=A0A1D3CVX6_9EIME|nr:hypothetical protein cyc_08437 [Cyclospora cayetanensis]